MSSIISNLPMVPPAEVTLGANQSVKDALSILDTTVARMALVVDEGGRIIGSVVDGDIRRGLLAGASLESPVTQVMAQQPYLLPLGTPRARLLEAMRTLDIRQIPLVTPQGKLAGVVVYDMLAGLKRSARSTPVVIMAGGKGKRLMPITTDIPKPLVHVGGRPILEWIILRLTHYGLQNITLSVNYLGHMIEDYFGNGKGFDCHISYIREKEFLGTAGALSLMEKQPAEPLLVMNGDLLTAIDFEALLDFHGTANAAATVCARAHQVQVPFGVIQQEGGLLTGISEKPVYENLISAGMYVLSPAALREIPHGQYMDMPTVLLNLAQKKQRVAVYAMDDEWVDVGRHDDLTRAQQGFAVKS